MSEYVKSCHPCQSVKPARKINPKAREFKVPDTRFHSLHTDVVGPLPESEGMRYILTILCRNSKWVECVPLPQASSINCCNGFIRGWLQRYGCPQEIFCDNAQTYHAGLWQDLQRVLGVEVKFVPPYHQSTNGAIERQHRAIKESMKASLIEMGDIHKSEWMSQLPLTMLGRRAALQPELNASPAQMVLGGEPVLPGVLVPDTPESKQESHVLLKTLQQNAARPAVPMSRHRKIDEEYLPKEFESATHVYVKLDNPENLGQKYVGPYVIISRPTNTQVTIRVGYDKDGVARLQTHHWNNCRVAHLRPDAQEAVSRGPGRPRRLPAKTNMAAEFEKETLSEPVTQPNNIRPGSSATMGDEKITQPRTTSDRFDFSNAGDAADIGSLPLPSPSHRDTLSYSTRVTGPPNQQPFTHQNNNNFSRPAEPVNFPEPGLEPGREPLPPEANGRLAPPVTKGAPQSSPAPSSTSNLTPASSTQAGQNVLHDHDYFRRPTATLDHNYYQPLPDPPPGFNHGRPSRNRQVPNRFNDFQLYAVNCY